MEALGILAAVAAGLALTLLVVFPGLRKRGGSVPDRSELYRQVVEAMVAKDSAGAVRLLREICLQRTDDWNAQVLLGDLLRSTGQTDRALRIHQTLAAGSVDGSQSRERILESIARDYLAMRRPAEALKAVRGSVGQTRSEQGVWEVVWKARDAMGDAKGARDALRSFYKTGAAPKDGVPSLAEYTTYLGQKAAAEGDAKGARQLFKEALRLDPELHVVKVFLGDVLCTEGKDREAIELWTEFSRQCPNEAEMVFRRLEKTLFQLGRFGDLNAIYETILADDPRHPAALAGLARMYIRRGMHEEAEGYLHTLLESHPRDRHGRRLLMGSLLSSGKTMEAREIMDRWLERDEPSTAICRSCGHQASDLFVRCSQCGAWNTTVAVGAA